MGTLTDLINRFFGATLSWIDAAMWIGIMLGIVMVTMGIVNMAHGRHTSFEESNNGVFLLLFGASLTSLITFIATGSETAFGTDQVETVFKTLKH